MRRSDLFLPATRETPGAGSAAAKLLVRAGLVREFGSGLWGFTPAGQRVREKLTARITAGMDAIGGQRVHLPGLQHRERWQQSGRWGDFEGEMFTLENRDGQAMCLAPSHEEGVVHLVDGRVRSHDDLPLLVYQVGAKFRDDHARNGLVRTKEFAMKDAYSFHVDEDGLDETYRAVRRAYADVLADIGLEFAVVGADNSVMGGSASEEFVAPVAEGGDRLVHCTADGCRFGVTDEREDFAAYAAGDACPDCGGDLAASDGIEVGHTFQLGTRYSDVDAMDLTVDTADGREVAVRMGSYGIGIDRLLQTLVQQHGALGGGSDGAATGESAESQGCAWPVTDWGCVAPYRAAVIPVGEDGGAGDDVGDDGGGDAADGGGVMAVAERIYEQCGREDVLLYDDLSVGERFAESDLLGVPAKVVVGNTYREQGVVDVETASGTERLDPDKVAAYVRRFAAERAAGRSATG